MSEEKEFPKGIRWNNPNENAPEFIKGKLSFKIDEFIPYLQEKAQSGWVNLLVKKSQKGNIYLDLDTWKPNTTSPEQAREAIEQERQESFAIPPDTDDEIKVENIPFN